MRRLIFGAAAIAVVALACGRASADYGYRGYYGPRGRGSFDFRQPYYQPYQYPARAYYPSPYGYYGDSFSETARQIREAHSRYRFYTHPRSIYNSPPRRYDYRGW